MQLTVDGRDLVVAAHDLRRVAGALEQAGEQFDTAATGDVEGVGRDAATAVVHAAAATHQALTVVVGDIDTLADALTALAHGYTQLDRTAVPSRVPAP